MRRVLPVLALAFLWVAVLTAPASAAPFCASGQQPDFVFGFAHLRSLLADKMGEAIECEHANPENGDTLQQTTTGLAFYRQSTNIPTFTNGWEHWGWTVDGLVFWTGESIDPPGVVSPAPTPPPSPTPTIRAEGRRLNFWGFPCDALSDSAPRFSASITNLEAVRSIVPPGEQAGSVIKQHSFIHLDFGHTSISSELGAAVYAPADSRLATLSFYDEGGVGQYLVFFEVSCEVVYKFDHLSSVVDRIRAFAPSTPRSSSATEFVNVPVRFEAGDLIGYTTGAPPSGPFDFGVFNTSHRNAFANQNRYESRGYEQLLHADCPYDYYDAPMREMYLALFGTPGGASVTVSDCRSFSRDVDGAVAGAWFGDSDQEADFAIAATLSGQVRLGGPGFNVTTNQNAPSYADPESVTTEHCFENWPQGSPSHAYLRLLSATELAVAYGPGSCPAEFPADYQTYRR